MALLAAGLMLAACTASGPAGDPVSRSFTWFSYLNGDDIRARCSGFRDRYRLVYNALWQEQVRTYDVTQESGGQGAMLEAHVFGNVNLMQLRLSDPLASWRGESSLVRMPPAAVAALDAALAQAGFEQPARRGMVLQSDRFYWIAMACRDGRFHWNAWLAPSPEFARLDLLSVLNPYDGTRVAVNPPRRVPQTPFRPHGYDMHTSPEGTQFQVQVTENGIRTGPSLF